MFSVVVQHMSNSFPNDFVYHKLIAISNMAVFFFVSGYIIQSTAKISGLKDVVRFIWKKCKQLLLPFVVWGLLVNNFFFKSEWSILTIQDLVDEWHHPSLWFLLTLFGYMLWYGLYGLVTRNVRMGGAKIMFWLIALALNAALWKVTGDFGTSLNYLPYFAIGVLFADLNKVDILGNKYLSILALPIIFLVTSFWSSGSGSFLNLGLKFLVSISVIIVIYRLCTELDWNSRINGFISMCGINSLAIYCVHRYFTNIWMPNVPFTNNEFLALLYATCLAIILCYLCVFFKRIVQQSPLTDFLLFGTSRYKTSFK